MLEHAMNYQTLVRDLGQVQSQADTLREQAIGDVPIDPAAVPLMSGIGDHADRLRQVVETIAGLLAADGGALAVVDQDGAVQWATATSQPISSPRSNKTSKRDPGWTPAPLGSRWPSRTCAWGSAGSGSVRSRPATSCGPPWPPPSGQTARPWGRSRSSWQRPGCGHKPRHRRSAATPASSGGCLRPRPTLPSSAGSPASFKPP